MISSSPVSSRDFSSLPQGISHGSDHDAAPRCYSRMILHFAFASTLRLLLLRLLIIGVLRPLWLLLLRLLIIGVLRPLWLLLLRLNNGCAEALVVKLQFSIEAHLVRLMRK